MKKAARDEARDNDISQRRQHRSAVLYGDVVQLWHPHSRRYLQAESHTVAKVDSTNLRVSLSIDISGGCQFRVMPRYKIRAIGDAVGRRDEVVLESVKYGGFLHTSTGTLGENQVGFERPPSLGLTFPVVGIPAHFHSLRARVAVCGCSFRSITTRRSSMRCRSRSSAGPSRSTSFTAHSTTHHDDAVPGLGLGVDGRLYQYAPCSWRPGRCSLLGLADHCTHPMV